MAILLGVTPVPTPKPKIKTLTIEVPLDEAFALQAVLGQVAGPPGAQSRRGLCDKVLYCLEDATRDEKHPSHNDCEGTITFKRKL